MDHRFTTYVRPSPATSAATERTAADKRMLRMWEDYQLSENGKVITTDDFKWKVPSTAKQSTVGGGGNQRGVLLKYVGGVDVSFSKKNPSVACATIVVLDLQTLEVVDQGYSFFTPQVPYVAGFLGFREVPILKDLLDKMKRERSPFFPQIVMVDGNGILHPRGFGSASHLGVSADVPTIGVAKNLHYVDGITDDEVSKLLKSRRNISKDFVDLKGHSGQILGAAMRPANPTQRPSIFISIGHRISLETAIEIFRMTCKDGEQEPIRQADLISRKHIQEYDRSPARSASSSRPSMGQRGRDGASRCELDGIVNGIGSIKMNDENHQTLNIMGSVGFGRRCYSTPLHGESRACFSCGKKGHVKRNCPGQSSLNRSYWRKKD